MKRNLLLAKFGILIFMLLGATSVVKAEEDIRTSPTLTAAPVEIAIGEEAEVAIGYESTEPFTAYQLRVVLPEGLSYVGSEIVDEDGETTTVFGTLGNACLASHSSDISLVKGNLFFIVYNLKMKALKNGILCKFKVKADENLADNAQIQYIDTKFSGFSDHGTEMHSIYMKGTIDVKKKIATGINGVEAEGQDAEAVYSIGGVRLNKAAKGVNVVIRNGKAIKVVK